MAEGSGPRREQVGKEQIAAEIAALWDAIRGLQSGTLNVTSTGDVYFYNDNDDVTVIIGGDGIHDTDPTPPPQPTDPTVTAVPGGAVVAWDGELVGGAARPANMDRVEIRVAAESEEGPATVYIPLTGAYSNAYAGGVAHPEYNFRTGEFSDDEDYFGGSDGMAVATPDGFASYWTQASSTWVDLNQEFSEVDLDNPDASSAEAFFGEFEATPLPPGEIAEVRLGVSAAYGGFGPRLFMLYTDDGGARALHTMQWPEIGYDSQFYAVESLMPVTGISREMIENGTVGYQGGMPVFAWGITGGLWNIYLSHVQLIVEMAG